jgi:hypothetical protein
MAVGPPLSAGRRDRWVVVEEFIAASTASGFPGGWWQPLCTLAMNRRAAGGDERFTADQTAAALADIWTAPYHPDLDPERVDVPALRRLSYLGRTYDIQRATPLDRRRGVELVTSAASKV